MHKKILSLFFIALVSMPINASEHNMSIDNKNISFVVQMRTTFPIVTEVFLDLFWSKKCSSDVKDFHQFVTVESNGKDYEELIDLKSNDDNNGYAKKITSIRKRYCTKGI